MRKGTLIAGVVVAMSVVALGVREWQRWPDGRTHIRFLDVGQGDSILITTPRGRIVVVDGGPDWSTLRALGVWRSFFRRSVDALILSHDDLDHVASFPELLERDRVGSLIVAETATIGAWRDRTIDTARQRGTTVIAVRAGQIIDLGEGLTLEILWPPARVADSFLANANDTAIVARLRQGDQSVLLTGDIEERTERTLVRAGTDLHATVLKVAHHGSKTSSSTGFLLAVAPTLGVISVGRDNTYGHPHPSILQRFSTLQIPLRRTDLEGVVELVWEAERVQSQ